MKCPHCPIAGLCIAETPGNAYACKFATSELASEREWLRAASAIVAGKPLKPAEPVQAVVPRRSPPDDSASPTVTASQKDFAANLPRVQACKSRVHGPECGCAAKMRCLKYRRDVSLADCLECVARGLDDPPNPADHREP